MKKIYLLLGIVLLLIGIIAPTAKADDILDGYLEYNVKVKVISIEEVSGDTEGFNAEDIIQICEVVVMDDSDIKGNTYYIKNRLTPDYAIVQIELKPGDSVEVMLKLDERGYAVEGYVVELVRWPYLLALIIVFVVVLMVVCRGKGVKTLLSLTVTVLMVAFFMIPLISKGYNPLLLAIVVCVFTTAFTMLIMNGFNSKSYSGILGTYGGLLLAGALSILVVKIARMTGISSHEVGMLVANVQGVKFDLQGLLLSAILIGGLGAVMDVAMSITASIHEVDLVSDNLSMQQLFKSGMTVGGDILGTMSNTLILAYTGGAINMILVLLVYDIGFLSVINRDYISSEILRALAGSIGMILTVPFTAYLSSFMIVNKRKKQKDAIDKEIEGEA